MAEYNLPSRGGWAEPEEERKWRKVQLQWTEQYYQDTKVSIADQKPRGGSTPIYNVLVVGCIQAGKSSTITTLMSAMRNDVGQYAHSGTDDKTVTTKVKRFSVKKLTAGGVLPINLWDTMGIEDTASPAGPTLRDLEYLMDGHIKDGYQLNPKESISFNSEYFNKEPTAANKMHVVVIVISSQTLHSMHMDVQCKLKQIIQLANDKDIRVAVILTKIDRSCALVEAELKRVFRSRTILNHAQDVVEKLGVSLFNVCVIKNYHDSWVSDLHTNILALDCLHHILKLADNTLEAQNMELHQPPTCRPALQTPWRQFSFDEQELATIWSELADWKVDDAIRTLNIVLLGPIGSGKSAFTNSVLSEFCQRMITKAVTGSHDSKTPTTTNFHKYPVCLGTLDEEMAMALWDTMGISSDKDMGMRIEDVDNVLDGNVKHRGAFNTVASIVVPEGARKPSLAEKMHLLSLTIDAEKFHQGVYQGTLLENMKSIISKAQQTTRSIPVCVLATNIDRVCQHVEKDIGRLYHSAEVRTCMDKIAKTFSIPMARIFPIVNFHNDVEIDWKKSLLIVTALKTMSEVATDYVQEQIKAEQQQKTGKPGFVAGAMSKLSLW